MGQGQSAAAPPVNATALRSGMADVLARPSRDRECGGMRAAPLHRWMHVAAPHASVEAAPVDTSSTSQRVDENPLSSKHSIFLSHSGSQKSFVEQLCLDVERHDRYPFFDKRRDSLPIGEDFPKLILEAIDQCQVGVVVLSEEFFSRSKWPMLEFAALVKRKARDPKFTIMPVFLGLTHAECRDKVKQARWSRIWHGWARADSRIKVKEWQDALKVFGYTNGISLNNGLDEVKCRQEIVEAVCKRVGPHTRWDDSHVQGRSRISSVIGDKIGRVKVCKSYGARILGIWGMGGMGKSTTCKVLCNEYFEEFEGRVCHVEFGVGNMLQMVQEVLRRLTDTNPEVIGRFSIGECKDRLKHELKKKVLLAIDNVWDSQEVVDNAKDLLRLGFCEGSIIIVTARSLGQLQNLNLNLEDCIEMPDLEEEDGRSLFLYHAAPNMYLKSVAEINEQVKKCIQRCYFRKGNGMNYHYHPLALKVLGGQLGNEVDEWMDKLELYGRDPFNQYGEEEKDHPVFSILGRSFEILNEEDKLLFMDVAIFLPTYGYKYLSIFEWLSLVHGKGLHDIMRRLKGLMSKSLLENLGDGRKLIVLHDLWHEYAGRKANGREFDQQPCIYEAVYKVNDPRREESALCGGGWKRLQRVRMVGNGRECIVKELSLSRCSKLRVLSLEWARIESGVLDLRGVRQLKSLVILGSYECEVYFVGLGSLKELVVLHLEDLETNLIVLQEEIATLTNLHILRVAHLSHKTRGRWLTSMGSENTSGQDRSMGDRIMGQSKVKGSDVALVLKDREIGVFVGDVGATNAKEMGYLTCRDLPQVKELAVMGSPSMGNVKGSELLLTSLDLSKLIFLRDVKFQYIWNHLDKTVCVNSNMTHLKRLKLNWCSSLRSCHGVGDLVALEILDLSGCTMLEEVPHLRKLKKLLKLRVSWCESIKAVLGLGDLFSLKEFKAVGCDKLVELSPNMHKLVNLRTVDVRRCPKIKALPDLSNLISLEELCVDFVALQGCYGLHKLKKVKVVSIYGWGVGGIPCLADLHSLTSLNIKHGFGVDGFNIILNMRRLQTLDISYCDFKDVSCLSNLTTLKSLAIWSCNKLERLPNMHKLSRLRSLSIYSCRNLREWETGSGLRNFGGKLCINGALLCLERLSLHRVALMELLDLSHFPQLRQISIEDCEHLTVLTSSVPLIALEVLYLKSCGVVRALRSQLDVSHLVSPISLKLWLSKVLQLMCTRLKSCKRDAIVRNQV